MTPKAEPPQKDNFIPTTMEREIAKGIVFRPIRSWHSNTYAGEGLYKVDNDGSGCLMEERFHGLEVCGQPRSVTHRLYWNRKHPDKTISAFLSYPNGLGCCDEYFWEALGVTKDGNERRYSTEKEMERAIIRALRRTE